MASPDFALRAHPGPQILFEPRYATRRVIGRTARLSTDQTSCVSQLTDSQ
jgi:hypothetical protein